jgi:thioredoxin 1
MLATVSGYFAQTSIQIQESSMYKVIATALFAFSTFATGATAVATGPYDEAADAKAEITATLTEAQRAKVPVIVVFGANWCGDCKMLDTAFKSGASAPLIAKNFKVVKVNVGRFDRNVDIAESYGVPLKSGIPAVAILSEQGKVTYATRAGELADARKMGDDGVYEFLNKVAHDHS